MKKFLRNLVKVLLVCGFLFPMKILAQGSIAYTIDPAHSYVLWHINHFGFSNPSGKWFVTGDLTIDEKSPQNSQVNVSVNLADIVTGNPELDRHLKSAEFFDASKFPTATFKSNKVVMTGKSTAKIQGVLTLHGISKPVTLDATLNKQGQNPITDKDSIGFSARTQLNRSEFGINTLLPGLSDQVPLEIELEAYKAS
jgi:polyisoprenoid-binding protein YceI